MNKKVKLSANNENLCPLTRKRLKSISNESTIDSNSRSPTWKQAKLQATTNFITTSVLTKSTLEEMGIGMLESEESSSSVASAIVLAVSASADENSNEATPNLDAPKFCHQRASYRSLDNTLDTTADSANNSFIDPNDTIKSNSNGNLLRSNHNNNSFEIYNNAPSQQQMSRRSSDKLFLQHHKKVAILGAGAGNIASPTINASSPSVLSVIGGGGGVGGSSSGLRCNKSRSPLATVTCNSNFRIVSNGSQQQSLNSGNSNVGQITPHAVVGGTTSHIALRAHSPSMPSTSQQAALLKQQHQLQQQQQLHQVQLKKQQMQAQNMQSAPPRFVPDENFFLYRNNIMRAFGSDGKDYFTTLLSDEIILQIFKWLPKKTLIRCSYVCRRLNRCANDESLWTRLDLTGRSLKAEALESVLTRGVVILRLAQVELNHPVFPPEFMLSEPKFESKLQYLDLSMASITKPSLKMLLSCCRQLKKLSLEHVPLNDEICNEITKNTQLEALNMAMCAGLEAWSVRTMMGSLKNLNSLNISWTNLSVDAVTSLVTNITPNIMRLNIAGCRKTMFDSHLGSLVARCPQLLELDLSDCTGLTAKAIGIVCKFNMLEYLSLSRCYQIPASSYMELIGLPTLTYLDVFGILSDTALEMLERNFPSLGINKFIHSSVARPTVGTRRTSIWGLRTRD